LLRDDSDVALAPAPGLDDLEQLVRNTTAQGLTVELAVEGDRRPLPPDLELAAYRIVQESLTNVVKHAATGSARAVLAFAPDGLSIQVTDHGRGFDPAAPAAGPAWRPSSRRRRCCAWTWSSWTSGCPSWMASRPPASSGRDDLRVIILTTFEMDEYVYAALRAGASGFLVKRSTRDELINAVRVVAAGDALLAPSVTRRLLDRFAAAGRDEAPAAHALRDLTRREIGVLRMVATGQSNAEIAASLHLTEHTVKTHVSRILTTTGLRDRVQAVVLAYNTGLVAPG